LPDLSNWSDPNGKWDTYKAAWDEVGIKTQGQARAYQYANGLKADNIYGDATKAKLPKN